MKNKNLLSDEVTIMSSSPSEISCASSCDIHYRPEPPVRKNRIRSLLVIVIPNINTYIYMHVCGIG